MNGVGRRHDIVGVAAAALREIACAQQDHLSDLEIVDAGADGSDATRKVIAGIGGQRRHPFVDASPDQDVRLPDPEGLGPDLNLALARQGNWQVHIVERIGATRPMHQHCFHGPRPRPGLVFSKMIRITKIIASGSVSRHVRALTMT